MATDGQARVLYFDNGVFAGERRIYCCGASSGGKSFSAYWPNVAYFCPFCGEVWGRAILQHEFDYQPLPQTSWTVEKRPCVQHGDGQFLVGYDIYTDLGHAGKDLLTRELLALIEGVSNGR